MISTSDSAVEMFFDGYNCAQSVLASCGQRLGLDPDIAISLAQTLGGGIARSGSVCGAVTGALMSVGLLFSSKDAKDKATKEESYRLAEEFLVRFRSRHVGVCCRDLISFDLSSPESRAQAAASGVFQSICPGLVRDAVQIVEEIVAESKGNA